MTTPDKYDWPDYNVRNEKVGEPFKGHLRRHCRLYGDRYYCHFLMGTGHEIAVTVDRDSRIVTDIREHLRIA